MKLYKCPSCDTPESYNYDTSSCNVEGCSRYKEVLEYPDVTWGSVVAKRARESCNKLTDNERAELLKNALKRIEKGRKKKISPTL